MKDYRLFYIKLYKFIIRNFKYIFPVKILNTDNTFFWITPWGGTPLPFYAFVLALLYRLYRRTEVTLVFNDLMRNSELFSNYKEVTDFLVKLEKISSVIGGVKVIRLSEISSTKLNNDEKKKLEYFSKYNTIKYLRCSIKNRKYQLIYQNWYEELLMIAERIKSVFYNNNLSYIIVPGGIFQETGFIIEMCVKMKVPFYTYDSSEGRVLVGVNAIAARNINAIEVYKEIVSKRERDLFSKKSYQYMKYRRTKNNDKIEKYTYGRKSIPTDITIFVNIEDDTAALGTHIFYEDDTDWLISTIKFILNKTRYSIVLREHPDVKRFGNEKALCHIQKLFENHKRFRFVSCRDKINSYEQIKSSKVIVVNTSTIGLESAMMGKQVITESESYYSNMPFVIKCDNEGDYFNALVNAVEKVEALNIENQKSASIYYGLTQLCSGANSHFTAQNKDYMIWIEQDIKKMMESGETKLFIKSLIARQSLTKIKYNKIYKLKEE